ncbi:MAG: hypothetical protein JW878_00245 [Methanomicrobia archaeon]|nr:hypothetical protein [Methanomicrobia archaeon]
MEPDIGAVLGQFDSIRDHTRQILQRIGRGGWVDYTEEGKILVEEYTDAKMQFERIKGKQKFKVTLLDIEWIPSGWAKEKALLRRTEIECSKAIGALGSIGTPLPKDELDKLSALREELEKLSKVLPDINYERNLSEAIDEYVKGDYLASALISGRVIIYALNQIPRKSDEEKVKFLLEKKIVEENRKDIHEAIIKASRKARNFFSHDIKVIPTPSEAHSLLGESIGILDVVSKVLKDEEYLHK